MGNITEILKKYHSLFYCKPKTLNEELNSLQEEIDELEDTAINFETYDVHLKGNLPPKTSNEPIWFSGTTSQIYDDSTFNWGHISRLREQIEEDVIRDIDLIEKNKPATLLKRK